MSKKKAPRNLAELGLLLAEVCADAYNGDLDPSQGKIIVGASSNIVKIAGLAATQIQAAGLSKEINILDLDFSNPNPIGLYKMLPGKNSKKELKDELFEHDKKGGY